MEFDSSQKLDRTFAILKPDVVRAGTASTLLDRISAAGFQILGKRQLHMTREQATQFYAEHEGKGFFEGLIAFMTSGPCIVLALAAKDAVPKWRETLLPLRKEFGTDSTQNACHGSDSTQSAARELRVFFPQLVAEPVPSAAAVGEFMASQVNPVLTKGLTELVKVRPSDPVRWLAYWLLENNPHAPRVQPDAVPVVSE
jgi:nucleoside-diphosphate kinase